MSQQPSPHHLYSEWEEGIHEAQLVAQVAWQIFKAELALANGEQSSLHNAIEVPDDIEDILVDILQACRVCVSAFQNPGKAHHTFKASQLYYPILVTLPYSIEDLTQSPPIAVSVHLPPDGQPFVVVDSNQNIVGFNLPGAISDKLQRLAETAQRRIFKKRPCIFVEGLEEVYHEDLDAIFMPAPREFGRGIPKISPCWLNDFSKVFLILCSFLSGL